MTVLVVGNSVSQAPGPGIPAFPERLSARVGGQWRLETVVNSGATIEQLEADAIAALARSPQRLVLQVGINECAPRPLGWTERERLGRLRPLPLRNLIIRIVHLLRPTIIRVRRLQQFTPLPRFVASAGRVVSSAVSKGIPVLILPITSVTPVAELRTPYTNREIRRFNEGLTGLVAPLVRVVSQAELFGSATAEQLCVTPDSVHLGADAHARIAEFIAAWLESPRAAAS
jgi:lysophospholipase L1-like esterase